MRFTVPASSANLGPGFDSFGIAWQCYNQMEFEISERLIISGCEERFCNENNLAWRSWCAAFEAAGKKAPCATIRFLKTDIPVSRGMGSSAALIAASVQAANRLGGLGFDRQMLLETATKVEGHPDNVAPALFGGFSISAMSQCRIVSVQSPVSESLHFALLIPDFELSTELSRSVMPKSVTMSDAVFNLSRSALLVKAFESGDMDIMGFALDDRLHQPYRTGLISGYESAKEIASNSGVLLCISGAGSTILCVSDSEAAVSKVEAEAAIRLPSWKVLKVKPDFDGVKEI